MTCSKCNILLPGSGPVRTCPRCFTTTSAALADTEPPPDSAPEIVIHDDGVPEPSWHPLIRRLQGGDRA